MAYLTATIVQLPIVGGSFGIYTNPIEPLSMPVWAGSATCLKRVVWAWGPFSANLLHDAIPCKWG